MSPGDERFDGTGRFRLQRCVGRGGFGIVHVAQDLKRGTLVALKTLDHIDPSSLYRFKQEFRSLADVQHPNLVKLYELLSDGEKWFFTMEMVEGLDFLRHVSNAGRTCVDDEEPTMVVAAPDSAGTSTSFDMLHGRTAIHCCDPNRLRSALCQLVRGVCALHDAGKLHRDLKPSNVLVTPEGRVVILDFGLVKEFGDQSSDKSLLVGTPAYMSPEQSAGLSLARSSDWYAVGLMMYEALAGNLPFHGSLVEILRKKQTWEPAESDLGSGTPGDLRSLCKDLLRLDPGSRPSGEEVLERLTAAVDAVAQPIVSPQPRSRGTAFVGRQKHLKFLRDAFRAIQQRGPMTVLLHGSSGMGKTTLVRRFLDELRQTEPNAVILRARCYEKESVPYKGLDSLVDALVQRFRRLPPLEVEKVLPRETPVLATLFPVMREFSRSFASPLPTMVTNSWELRRRGFQALRELLARIATFSPLVLFIDDLHWGDLDSARLLQEILRPPDAPALLLIVSYRTEEAETSPLLRELLEFARDAPSKDAFVELEVGEMSIEEGSELALALSGEHCLSLQQAEFISCESEGIPFFIHELVRYGEQRGTPWQPSSNDRGDGNALDNLILARLSQLEDSSRLLLEIIAVAGGPVERGVLVRAAQIQHYAAALDTLRERYLIRPRFLGEQEEVEIYHARIAKSVLAYLPAETRKERHYRIAVALEDSGHADAETLFVHYHAADERGRAARFAVAAAEQAWQALAFERAARLYRSALEDNPPDDSASHGLRVRLGEALANAGRGEEAARAYLFAAETAPVIERLQLQQRAVRQFFRSGRFDEGLAALRVLLPALRLKWPEAPRLALLLLFWRRLQLRLRALRFQERAVASISIEDLVRIDTCWSVSTGLGIVDPIRGAVFQALHLLLALRAGEPFRVSRAVALEAAFSAAGGGRCSNHTNRLFRRASELAERVNTPEAQVLVTVARGIACYLRGEWKEGAANLEQTERLLVERGSGVTLELDNARIFGLRCLLYMGELQELRRRAPAIIQNAYERGDLYLRTMLSLRTSSMMYLIADEPSSARRLAAEVIAQWSHLGFHAPHYIELYIQALIDLYLGEVIEARNRVREGWGPLRRSLILRTQFALIEISHLRACTTLAVASTGLEQQAMLQAARRDADTIERERMPWGNALAGLIRAGVAVTSGDRKAGLQLLARAEQNLLATDMKLHAAAARYRRGEMMGGVKGQALIDEGKAWMHERGIVEPARFTAMLVPGKF